MKTAVPQRGEKGEGGKKNRTISAEISDHKFKKREKGKKRISSGR